VFRLKKLPYLNVIILRYNEHANGTDTYRIDNSMMKIDAYLTPNTAILINHQKICMS